MEELRIKGDKKAWDETTQLIHSRKKKGKERWARMFNMRSTKKRIKIIDK